MSSDGSEPDADGVATEVELLAAGWERCFVADEPRLSEAVALYQELGYEVTVGPVPLDSAACTGCIARCPERFRVIYTRRRDPPGGDDGADDPRGAPSR